MAKKVQWLQGEKQIDWDQIHGVAVVCKTEEIVTTFTRLRDLMMKGKTT